VAELVDARDLKSLELTLVPVRVRPRVPYISLVNIYLCYSDFIMIRPLSLFIGWRYTNSKKRSRFVSFISLASMLGIALGVTVLITVLSVMNGFDKEVRDRYFTVIPHVTAVFPSSKKGLPHWNGYRNIIQSNSMVKSVMPFAQGKAMLMNAGHMNAALIFGVRPEDQLRSTDIGHKVIDGDFNRLVPQSYGIALSERLAKSLNLAVDDKVSVYLPILSTSILGAAPRQKFMTVNAIYKDTGVDSMVAYVNIKDAGALYNNKESWGAHIRLYNFMDAGKVSRWLSEKLGAGFYVTDWSSQLGPLSQALNMEKTMLFIILSLIVAVAAFNLVSTLVMVVTDKQADIAILKTLGAPPRMIMFSFMFQGLIIGVTGAILGVIGGVSLSSHISSISVWLQHTLHVQLIPSQVYGVNYLPSMLLSKDVVHVSVVALLMCLLATIYPAYLAQKTHPAEALRYE
jgi:lipoprotein-releasing system permease protein